jgi:hypothetical protein
LKCLDEPPVAQAGEGCLAPLGMTGLLSSIFVWEGFMQMVITFMAVVAGLIFSVAVALLAEEFIFGQVFRLFFTQQPVQQPVRQMVRPIVPQTVPMRIGQKR